MTHPNITNKLSESCGGKCLCKEICRIITWSDILNINFFLSFSISWLNEKNFGGICLVRSLLMNPSFIWATHATLSSNSIVGSLLTGNPQVTWMCWVTDLSIHILDLLMECYDFSVIRRSGNKCLLLWTLRDRRISTCEHISCLRPGFMWILLAQRPSTLVLMMINSCSYVY